MEGIQALNLNMHNACICACTRRLEPKNCAHNFIFDSMFFMNNNIPTVNCLHSLFIATNRNRTIAPCMADKFVKIGIR